jgi:hypothetical protein
MELDEFTISPVSFSEDTSFELLMDSLEHEKLKTKKQYVNIENMSLEFINGLNTKKSDINC